ncbi:hypothetical protein XENOCAPTIV_002132 [Xenoophorus captivus]|uniref:Uncharacterized protein n=1 Tax=Xenoophorus captivus TaxID=1517983 RepID=A0ABV0QPE5_9TELE
MPKIAGSKSAEELGRGMVEFFPQVNINKLPENVEPERQRAMEEIFFPVSKGQLVAISPFPEGLVDTFLLCTASPTSFPASRCPAGSMSQLSAQPTQATLQWSFSAPQWPSTTIIFFNPCTASCSRSELIIIP